MSDSHSRIGSPSLSGCIVLIVGGALALGLLVGAASAQPATDWNSELVAAKQEGKVVLYGNPAPTVLARMRMGFEKAYPGISLVNTRIAAAPDVVSKADQERTSGIDGADVIISTDGATAQWYEDHAKQHLLAMPVGPNVRAWPAHYLARDGFTPIMMLEPIVTAYNSNVVKTPITGYRDYLGPEFKGHLGTSDIISPSLVAWYLWLEKTLGVEFVDKLAAQIPLLYNGAVPQSQAAASGEIHAALFVLAASANDLIDQGAPLKIVVPNPSFGVAYTTAILGWSKRPHAAQVLMNYLLSPEWQTLWSGRGETASPLPGIPGSIDPASVDTSMGAVGPEAAATYKAHWDTMFKKK